MSKNSFKNIIITLLLLIIIALFAFIIININNNKTNTIENNNTKKDYNEETKDNNADNYSENNKNTKNNIDTKESNTTTSNNDNSVSKNTTNNSKKETTTSSKENKKIDVTSYTEEDVISYVRSIENEIDTSNITSTIKDKFITIVDFIFYDTEIKGYKFSDLTNSAKIEIISACLKIDSKIEEYVPNYKDTISSKYNDIKDRLVMLYLDTTINVCKNNKQECDIAKDIFGEIKDSCKIGFSYIKDILTLGKNKLKDYYEVFRDSN